MKRPCSSGGTTGELPLALAGRRREFLQRALAQRYDGEHSRSCQKCTVSAKELKACRLKCGGKFWYVLVWCSSSSRANAKQSTTCWAIEGFTRRSLYAAHQLPPSYLPCTHARTGWPSADAQAPQSGQDVGVSAAVSLEGGSSTLDSTFWHLDLAQLCHWALCTAQEHVLVQTLPGSRMGDTPAEVIAAAAQITPQLPSLFQHPLLQAGSCHQ